MNNLVNFWAMLSSWMRTDGKRRWVHVYFSEILWFRLIEKTMWSLKKKRMWHEVDCPLYSSTCIVFCEECQGKIKVELSGMCTSSCCLDLKTGSTVWVKKLAALLTWCWVGLQLKAAQFATNSMFHPKIYTCNTHVPPNCGDWVFSSSKVASWPWRPVQLHFHNFISLP